MSHAVGVRKSVTAVGATLALAVGLAACGGSSSGGSTPTDTPSSQPSASSTAIAEAQNLLSQLETRPTELPVTTPVGKAVPKGLTIDWLVCGVPDCTILTGPLKDAAAALGWTIHPIAAGLTPESVKAAWDLAVRDHPDAVMATGFPRVIFEPEIAQLKAANIPIIDGFVTDDAGNGLTAVVAGGGGTFENTGKAFADYVAGVGGTSVNAVFVGGKTFPGLDAVQNAFEAELKRLCSTCSVDGLNIPATAIGKDLPSDVVAYLTKHPDVNYVVTGEGSMNIGLPQAFQSAHLNVKLVGPYPSQTTIQYVANGQMDGLIFFPQGDAMWQMMDCLVRYEAKVPVAPCMAPAPAWAVTKATAGQLTGAGPYFQIADYASLYKKLWGVS